MKSINNLFSSALS